MGRTMQTSRISTGQKELTKLLPKPKVKREKQIKKEKSLPGKSMKKQPKEPKQSSADRNLQKYLQKNNLQLPPPFSPVAVYVPVAVVGNLAYVSGHGPYQNDKTNICGKVGKDLTVEQGYNAARQTGLSILQTLISQFGSLGKIKRVIKSLGMVNCPPDFKDHPKVINGYSDLLAEVFGNAKGVGARSAVGMGSLPSNIAVEIEVILELEDD